MAQAKVGISLLCRTCLRGVFLGGAATLYSLGAMAGYLGNWALYGVTAAMPVLAGIFLLRSFFVELPQKNRLGLFAWFLILAILVIEIALGLLPPTARDELTHHLALPKLYARAGRLVEIPFAPYSYYPMLLDMLYTPWVRWGWDFAPKLIHGLYGFLAGLLIHAYLSQRLSPLYGLLGFLFFISTPAVLRLAHWAYVDLGLVFYTTASILCLLQWLETRRGSWLVLAALSLGFALATKPNALLVALLTIFLLALRLGGQKGSSRFFWALLFLAVVFIPFAPWPIKNLIQTGNPLFPFFGGLFGSGAAEESAGGIGTLAKRVHLYGEGWLEIIGLPLRVFFSGRDDSPQFFDGLLNPMLILFLPWAFKGKWAEEKKLLFSFSALYFLYALLLVDMRVRYILPIVPPLVILLVYGIHNVYLRIARPALLFAALAALLGLNGVYLWNHVRTVSPLGYLTGSESREAYLSRMLPEYHAIRFINEKLPPGSRIYFIFVGRRVYHCECDYFHDPGDNPWTLLQMIRNGKDGLEILAKLREKGLTHLLSRDELFIDFLNDNLSLEERKRWVAFARAHLSQLFHWSGFSVYEIHG